MRTLRRADAADIDALVRIRGAVRENRLRDRLSVSRADYDWFIAQGRVWLCDLGGQVAGFSAGDPRDGTIWALFVDPDCEGLGLGAELLARAVDDLRADGHHAAQLSTDPGTKAARLYRKLGWQEVGPTAEGELEFRLTL
ncbi:MAG: acetyltransferase [Rhodobacteraceae bacterium]|nr:MAG: acetyltransferase [Paracoccaceae bacterium]